MCSAHDIVVVDWVDGDGDDRVENGRTDAMVMVVERMVQCRALIWPRLHLDD